jgi:hypothetical protein
LVYGIVYYRAYFTLRGLMKIISRAEAKSQGLVRYYTGKPCCRGHVSERYSRNGACLACIREDEASPAYKARQAAKALENKDEIYRKRKEYREANKDRLRAEFKAKYWENPEKYREESRRWARENSEKVKAVAAARYRLHRDEVLRKVSEYRKTEEGRAKTNARNRNRTATKTNATPPWSNKDEIEKLYLIAARIKDNTGQDVNVDHYYPIQGRTVCGLHVAENLQIISAEENFKKKNRHPEEWDAYKKEHGLIFPDYSGYLKEETG